MTSAISSSTTSFHRTSPLQRLQQTLESQVQSGSIASADQSALSSALKSIDGSLSDAGRTQSGNRAGDPKAKIDSLIDAQVSAGKLTSDQAQELRGIFSAAFGSGSEGAGGLPPGLPPMPLDEQSGDTAGAGSSNSASGADVANLLRDVLAKLSETSSSYGGNGAKSSSSKGATLFFDQAV